MISLITLVTKYGGSSYGISLGIRNWPVPPPSPRNSASQQDWSSICLQVSRQPPWMVRWNHRRKWMNGQVSHRPSAGPPGTRGRDHSDHLTISVIWALLAGHRKPSSSSAAYDPCGATNVGHDQRAGDRPSRPGVPHVRDGRRELAGGRGCGLYAVPPARRRRDALRVDVPVLRSGRGDRRARARAAGLTRRSSRRSARSVQP